MTILNVYSKEQTDAKLEHIATTITDKTTHYEIDANSAVTTGADVPAPTSQDVGKFLKVDENADLVYAEGGGSGGSGSINAYRFASIGALYNFLNSRITSASSYGMMTDVHSAVLNGGSMLPPFANSCIISWQTAVESAGKTIIMEIYGYTPPDIDQQTNNFNSNNIMFNIGMTPDGNGGISIDGFTLNNNIVVSSNGVESITPIRQTMSESDFNVLLPWLTLFMIDNITTIE